MSNTKHTPITLTIKDEKGNTVYDSVVEKHYFEDIGDASLFHTTFMRDVCEKNKENSHFNQYEWKFYIQGKRRVYWDEVYYDRLTVEGKGPFRDFVYGRLQGKEIALPHLSLIPSRACFGSLVLTVKENGSVLVRFSYGYYNNVKGWYTPVGCVEREDYLNSPTLWEVPSKHEWRVG